jgi:hypothetical protein
MDPVVVGYLVYIALTVALTVWVASTLSRHGRVYLADVFGDERAGAALNQLLVVGFYLVNFGFAALWLHTGQQVNSFRDLLQMLSVKLGTVLLVVGALHLVNLVIFSRIRRNTVLLNSMRPATRPAPTDLVR